MLNEQNCEIPLALDISELSIPFPGPVPQLETNNLIKLTISQMKQNRQLLLLIHSMKLHYKMSYISSIETITLVIGRILAKLLQVIAFLPLKINIQI